MTKQDALDMIKNYEQNITELKEARKEAWDRHDRKSYDQFTRDIFDINQEIKALKECYLQED